MRATVSLVLLVVLGVALLATSAAATVCAPATPPTPREHLHGADVVLVGVALDGEVFNGEGLFSPARFRVTRYLKGSGPRVVAVETAFRDAGRLVGVTGGGITPLPGETWKLYAERRAGHPLTTEACTNSHRLRAAPAERAREGDNRRALAAKPAGIQRRDPLPVPAMAQTQPLEHRMTLGGLVILLLVLAAAARASARGSVRTTESPTDRRPRRPRRGRRRWPSSS